MLQNMWDIFSPTEFIIAYQEHQKFSQTNLLENAKLPKPQCAT